MIHINLKLRGDIEAGCRTLSSIVNQYSEADLRIVTQSGRRRGFYTSVIINTPDQLLTDLLIDLVGFIDTYSPDSCSLDMQRLRSDNNRPGADDNRFEDCDRLERDAFTR